MLRACGCLEGLAAACHRDVLQTPSHCPAIDFGLLRAWRRLALSRWLGTGDEGLILQILHFVGDLGSPQLFSRLVLSATSDSVCFGFSGHPSAMHLPGSADLGVLAAESHGHSLILGAPRAWPVVLLWDLRADLPDKPQVLQGLDCPASSLWLDAELDRAAAGGADGKVLLWVLSDGQLLASCEALILESTRWRTVGHTQDVCALASAPLDNAGAEEYGNTYVRGACVASADSHGNLCLWQENGYCVTCASAGYEAQNMQVPIRRLTCLATAPNLLVAGLGSAVLGFEAQSGSLRFALQGAGDSTELLTITVLPSSQVAAVRSDGAALLWTLPKAPMICEKAPTVLVEPWAAGCCAAVATANWGTEALLIWVAHSVSERIPESNSCADRDTSNLLELRLLEAKRGLPQVLQGVAVRRYLASPSVTAITALAGMSQQRA